MFCDLQASFASEGELKPSGIDLSPIMHFIMLTHALLHGSIVHSNDPTHAELFRGFDHDVEV